MKKTLALSVPIFVFLIFISGDSQSALNDKHDLVSHALLDDFLGTSWRYSYQFYNPSRCDPPDQCIPLLLIQQSLRTDIKEPFIKAVDFNFEWNDLLGIEDVDVNFIGYPHRKAGISPDAPRVPFRIENGQ